MPTIGAAQADFSNELYTALEYVQKYGTNADKRKLMMRHSYPDNFYQMLENLGLVRGMNGEAKIWHLEDDWLMENIKVQSIVTASTGAGTEVIFDLADVSMFTQNGVILSYPQARQEIEIPITREKVVILEKITVNSGTPLARHRLRVKPVDPTVNLAGKIVASQTLALTGNAWPELVESTLLSYKMLSMLERGERTNVTLHIVVAISKALDFYEWDLIQITRF